SPRPLPIPTLIDRAFRKAERRCRLCRPFPNGIRAILFLISVAAFGGFLLGGKTLASDGLTSDVDHKVVVPILRTHCLDCHDDSSDIDLSGFESPGHFAENRELWNRVLTQIRLGTMPPSDADPLPAELRQSLVDKIDALTNAIDCVKNPNAGRVALRRLNRREYRNTIKDLTGVDFVAAEDFPGDDVGYGFDNIGDVLSLPPILMEKYLDAAESITGQAIATPPPPRLLEIDKSPDAFEKTEKYSVHSGQLTMGSNGTVTLPLEIPFRGVFQVTVTAAGDQGGDQPCRMKLAIGKQDHEIDVPNETPEDFVKSWKLAKGKRVLEISFLNDYWVPNKADRNLKIYHVHIRGQETSVTSIRDLDKPASHDKILFVRPGYSDAPESKNSRAATANVIARFASRAFRRPATRGEVGRLVQLALQVRKDGGSFEESIQVAMQAILVSPHFLFKVEAHRERNSDGSMPSLSPYELATRISYFLWSSMPDDELLAMAHRDELRDRNKLLHKVASMLRDQRSDRLVENFAGQWLQIRNLDLVQPDTRRFPGFNDEIRDLMRQETMLFFAAILRENRPVTELIEADYTYLNEPLAKFYNINNVSGQAFRKVNFRSRGDAIRGGLLTQGSLLTVSSNPTRTSPVKRGKFILENLLNMPPPPAPPNVPELDKGPLTGRLRERMKQHREDPSCAACHSMMDPLGFAMENFDAVGRYRTLDGTHPIDSLVSLPDGTRLSGTDGLRDWLAGPRREAFLKCFTEKLMIYAIGRGTDYNDRCAIDEILSNASGRDYACAYIIAGIILSDPFQKQGFRP
ncbi:MAG: DUF1592 domain-containing protein, partial [Planctomycetota bacterium]